MSTDPHKDKSNGSEVMAEAFMSRRNARIGVETVREWTRTLPRACAVLDLGCGSGVPISQVLVDEGFAVYGIDASATLLAAFRARFPDAQTECAAVEDSNFFDRTFDGVISWGLMFLLPPDAQATLIRKVAHVLNPDGKFVFTSPEQAVTWDDALTGRTSISSGRVAYRRQLEAEGLRLVGKGTDEGNNHYYFAEKTAGGQP